MTIYPADIGFAVGITIGVITVYLNEKYLITHHIGEWLYDKFKI